MIECLKKKILFSPVQQRYGSTRTCWISVIFPIFQVKEGNLKIQDRDNNREVVMQLVLFVQSKWNHETIYSLHVYT